MNDRNDTKDASLQPPPGLAQQQGVSAEEAAALYAAYPAQGTDGIDQSGKRSATGSDALPEYALPGELAHREASKAAGRAAAREGWHAVGTAFLYLVVFRLSTFVPFTVTSTIFVTLIAMVIALVFTVRVARALQTPAALGVNFLLTVVFALPLIAFPILFQRFPAWNGWYRVGPTYGRYFGLIHHVLGLKELLLMWFAACIGAGISRLVREMKMLLPMGAVLALVDVFAVFGGGIVDQAVSGKSPLAQAAMNALTVSLPSARVTRGSAPMQLRIGFADFLFIALFFACFKRFGVAAWNTFIVLCAVLSVYMLIVAYKDLPLPALVPIAVVVIGMNLRQFRYERSEAFALLYATIIVGVVAGAFWFFGHQPDANVFKK